MAHPSEESGPAGLVSAGNATPGDLPAAAARAGDPVIGRLIGGNFRVLKLIGTGAMGHVYQAEQLSLGKMVALKLLRSELMGDDKLIKRFELEAKNASSLNHPNSIQIIDFGRDHDLLFIAMELLPGVDLGQLILREGPLPIGRIARIMDQVLAALDEAHAQRIVHRDLKPGNIMLASRRGDPDFVKVCDFGIAKAQTSGEGAGLTMKGLVCGTPEYMSPEQARGEEVDGRSDLYSVGVILYQLVTGELPFSASSPVGILSMHLAEPPVPPTLRRPGLAIPAAFEAVILRALAKDAKDRAQTAEQMRLELRAALRELGDWHPPSKPGSLESLNIGAGLPTTPITLPQSPPHVVDRHRPPSEIAVPATVMAPETQSLRRPAWYALGAVTLMGLAALGGWLLLARSRPSSPNEGIAPPLSMSSSVIAPIDPPHAPPHAPLHAPLHAPPQPAPPAAPPATVPAEAPAEAEPSEAAAAAKAPAPETHAERGHKPKRAPAKKAHPAEPPAEAPEPTADTTATPPAEPVAVADKLVAPPPTRAATLSQADLMREAERLLGQGEVASACNKGEEQRRMSPRLPNVYKFLGKCYMRAGQPDRAKENYRHYLDLAPDASDAAFIKSIVR